METHLKIIGIVLVLLSLIHVIFPTYFNWKENLASLSLINKQMMKVHTFFIALVVFKIGLLSIFKSHDLTHTSLGHVVCLGLSVFWGIRFFIQLFVYSSELWKGKLFETIVHVFFSVFWLYMTIVYGMIYWLSL